MPKKVNRRLPRGGRIKKNKKSGLNKSHRKGGERGKPDWQTRDPRNTRRDGSTPTVPQGQGADASDRDENEVEYEHEHAVFARKRQHVAKGRKGQDMDLDIVNGRGKGIVYGKVPVEQLDPRRLDISAEKMPRKMQRLMELAQWAKQHDKDADFVSNNQSQRRPNTNTPADREGGNGHLSMSSRVPDLDRGTAKMLASDASIRTEKEKEKAHQEIRERNIKSVRIGASESLHEFDERLQRQVKQAELESIRADRTIRPKRKEYLQKRKKKQIQKHQRQHLHGVSSDSEVESESPGNAAAAHVPLLVGARKRRRVFAPTVGIVQPVERPPEALVAPRRR
ncbi:hypothetical protein FVE85_5298 [Porphyridium purpureum]|uniref:Uncharacterized protein n=1 Tax=Porphyridium purpureum TaxID=35688 RepID=A0A5J4Z424_PORPP|nr:hypothetical protein FVE85_5298 [Porphyridium purpureum]|eukprot:POR7095..scf295_1